MYVLLVWTAGGFWFLTCDFYRSLHLVPCCMYILLVCEVNVVVHFSYDHQYHL